MLVAQLHVAVSVVYTSYSNCYQIPAVVLSMYFIACGTTDTSHLQRRTSLSRCTYSQRGPSQLLTLLRLQMSLYTALAMPAGVQRLYAYTFKVSGAYSLSLQGQCWFIHSELVAAWITRAVRCICYQAVAYISSA
jgi:hypothetical protein